MFSVHWKFVYIVLRISQNFFNYFDVRSICGVGLIQFGCFEICWESLQSPTRTGGVHEISPILLTQPLSLKLTQLQFPFPLIVHQGGWNIEGFPLNKLCNWTPCSLTKLCQTKLENAPAYPCSTLPMSMLVLSFPVYDPFWQLWPYLATSESIQHKWLPNTMVSKKFVCSQATDYSPRIMLQPNWDK